MNSRERVIRTLEFSHPDQLPVDLWMLPATFTRYGDAFRTLLRRYPRDIYSVGGYEGQSPDAHRPGIYVDEWGTTWQRALDGMVGQVLRPALEDWSALRSYRPPRVQHSEAFRETIEKQIRENADRYLVAWMPISPFQTMESIRGFDNLMVDFAEMPQQLLVLRDMMFEYCATVIKLWLEYDIDAFQIADDWGSEKALFIAPQAWRQICKPFYKGLFDLIRAGGKHVFFHSDGNILPIIDDFIELGVDALNCQLWCMGVEEVAARYAGRITFHGELNRQLTLPFGDRSAVRDAAHLMRRLLFVNGGGLIGQCEVGPDVPLENIEEALICWNS